MRRRYLKIFGFLAAGLLLGMIAAFFFFTQRTTGQYFDSNGVKLHYTDEGHGEPVILIHGFAANADNNWRWPGVIKALTPNYRVIAYDGRGHGLSDKPHDPKAYGIELVNDVIRLMDHLNIEKAHVIGYSMGGFITLKLITTHPNRLLSAMPCAAGWADPVGENKILLMNLARALKEGRGFDDLLNRLEPNGKKVNPVKMLLSNILISHFNDKQALAALLDNFEELSVTEPELRANKVPTLSIVGSIDPLRDGIDRMNGVMANQQSLFIKGGNHMTTIGRREFIEGIKTFLAAHKS